ncbi:ATP-binding protein [Actinacidiphila alni]|uniref:ATP-binding protein n=1 Tax=Actinacidiphila alni TaxID=380248 RepID=UPI0034569491
MSVRAVGWARSFPVTHGVRAGREWARGHLDALGWTTAAPDTADSVVLTVSELVANAHVHAHSDAQVVMVWDGTCLHLSVSDSSDVLPAARPPDDDRTHGRGMAIVDSLADAWEAHTRPDGKTVTAAFHAPDGECPHD